MDVPVLLSTGTATHKNSFAFCTAGGSTHRPLKIPTTVFHSDEVVAQFFIELGLLIGALSRAKQTNDLLLSES